MSISTVYQTMLIADNLPITIIVYLFGIFFYLFFGFAVCVDCGGGFNWVFGLSEDSDENSGSIGVLFFLFWPIALLMTFICGILKLIFLFLCWIFFPKKTEDGQTSSWYLLSNKERPALLIFCLIFFNNPNFFNFNSFSFLNLHIQSIN